MSEETKHIPEGARRPEVGNLLEERGWTIESDDFDEEGNVVAFEPPEGLKTVELEAHNLREGRIRNFLVYDPERADVETVKWNKEGIQRRSELLAADYQIIDTNVARGIFARTKPEAS